MSSLRYLALLSLIGTRIFAQSPPIAPSRTFDLRLDQRTGPNSAVSFFVARNAHLYFAISSAAGSLVLETTATGAVESTGAVSSASLRGFDVSGAGNAYVLYRDSRLVEFDAQWNVQRSLTLSTRIEAFAVAGGRPMAIGPDSQLRFLETPQPGFTLAAYPGPWHLFAAGSDAVGVLRPESGWLHVFQVDGVWSNHSMSPFPDGMKPIAATAAPDGQIFLLAGSPASDQTFVVQCDDHGNARFRRKYQLPEAFTPRMIAVTSDRLSLVNRGGQVAIYPRDASASPAEVFDSGPELLSDLEPVRDVVRRAGYTGPIAIEVDITETGTVRHAQMRNPPPPGTGADVLNAVYAWQFEPAMRSGKPAAVHIEINF